jgi:two-component system, OmpR family, sensor histidine kinase KdpD
MDRHRLSRVGGVAIAVVVGVSSASAAIAVLEGPMGVPDASSVYLVAVAGVAIVVGVGGAILTAVASVLIYDLLFTAPRFTLTVSDPGEWLNLVLLLFVAVTVGQLAALQRQRARVAEDRAREARALFEVTRNLATRDTTLDALPSIARALADDANMTHVWFALGADDASERPIAQSSVGPLPRGGRSHAVLHPGTGGDVPRWTSVRQAATTPDPNPASFRHYRVRMMDGVRPIGSLWAARDRGDGPPDQATTALLRVAADLVTQGLGHDRLVDETRRAEIAQQSDALKSALLESVSHDLRTPLASIRASAGTLMDPDVQLSAAEARASAAAIDREAQRLNRLVSGLLDLSRIEGGALRVTADALDLEDVVERAVAEVAPRIGDRDITVAIEARSTVLADPVLLEQALVNLLENIIRHTPVGASARITGRTDGDTVHLTVEDSGPGVPEASLDRIFERFVRVRSRPVPGTGSGTGTGIGLAVVRGFVEAMGGRVTARRSDLGGLAIELEFVAAAMPASNDERPVSVAHPPEVPA